MTLSVSVATIALTSAFGLLSKKADFMGLHAALPQAHITDSCCKRMLLLITDQIKCYIMYCTQTAWCDRSART